MEALFDESEIPWDEARRTNLANWESRVPLHLESYAIESFRTDQSHLSSVVRDDLAALSTVLPHGVAGLDVCHLQCHIGTDTVSLARAGARVTGVDFSPSALAAARALAEELGLDVTWVEADVLHAAEHVTGDFDLVYTSIGTICWLDDLSQWAAQIAALLRPGGLFYIRDGHPALYGLDETADGLVTRYRYFADGRAQMWHDESTYAGPGQVDSPVTAEFPHPLSEIINAVIGAGLTLRRLDEGDTLPWQFSEQMELLEEDSYAFPQPLRERIPTTFTLIARL